MRTLASTLILCMALAPTLAWGQQRPAEDTQRPNPSSTLVTVTQPRAPYQEPLLLQESAGSAGSASLPKTGDGSLLAPAASVALLGGAVTLVAARLACRRSQRADS